MTSSDCYYATATNPDANGVQNRKPEHEFRKGAGERSDSDSDEDEEIDSDDHHNEADEPIFIVRKQPGCAGTIGSSCIVAAPSTAAGGCGQRSNRFRGRSSRCEGINRRR